MNTFYRFVTGIFPKRLRKDARVNVVEVEELLRWVHFEKGHGPNILINEQS